MPVPSPTLYPSPSLFPGAPDGGLARVLRDRPPLRLAINVVTPDGHSARWAGDEPKAANALANLSFSTTMPGGFEQLSCVLARQPGSSYPDLTPFSTLTAYGIGDQIAWQGRLETTPRTSGDQMSVTPGAVGLQAHLDDDQSARMIYVDGDLTKWQPASTQLKISQATSWLENDGSVTPDASTGQPALMLGWQNSWAAPIWSKMQYDARGLPIASLYYAWKVNANVLPAFTEWNWQCGLMSTDTEVNYTGSSNLRASGPGSGTVPATDNTQTFAETILQYFPDPAGTDGLEYQLFWTVLAVYGNHGLTKRGTAGYGNAQGFYASDVVQHALATWAPKLATSKAGMSTIEKTTFVIPQLAFTDPTTASAILKAAISYQPLMDWWVDEGPTFNMASRSNHGRHWRAMVGPSGLQETGPQVSRMFNSVIVSYNDVAGISRTVGPTGSGANTIDDSLADTDPSNPVNEAGLHRPYEFPNIGTSTPAGAIAVGRRWLLEQKQRQTSGQANIVGHVQDDHGVWWPAWAIRAGDWIMFTDAHDTSERRIVKTTYTDSSRSCQLDLDSPPEDLDALLARMSASVASLGFK